MCIIYSQLVFCCCACSIVQGSDWHWGPTSRPFNTSNTISGSGQPTYIRDSALATSVLSFILFISYLVLQVCELQVHNMYIHNMYSTPQVISPLRVWAMGWGSICAKFHGLLVIWFSSDSRRIRIGNNLST